MNNRTIQQTLISTTVAIAVISLAIAVWSIVTIFNKHEEPYTANEIVVNTEVRLAAAGEAADVQQHVTQTVDPPNEPDVVNSDSDNNTNQITPVKKAPKVVYLTFDDGPSKFTDDIVDILSEHGIHGTFFMIGNQLKGNEQVVKEAHEAGNYIGLHSMSHDKNKLYRSGSPDHFISEFKKEQQLIEEITGVSPALIRAPYGSKPEVTDDFLDEIADAGFKMWDWTVDSKDWYYTKNPDLILKEIKRQVHRNQEVILLHEKPQTVEILPEIIQYLHNKGYAFAVYKPAQHFPVNFSKDERL